MKITKYISLALFSVFHLLSGAVYDHNSSIDTDTTWRASDEHRIGEYVFVEPGVTLTIEAGTTIKAYQGNGTDAAPALIVPIGAKIIAQGTADKPIVFTSILDNGNNNLGKQTGLWGGVIILGDAPINSNGSDANTIPLTNRIEGIPSTGIDQPFPNNANPTEIPASYANYGGGDPDDDSGILKYVSIRHGGAALGDGDEINGLTLGGVGTGTTIEHVEVFANSDDGIEFFGGTVNAKYLAVAYVGDDSFDFDDGYNGQLQFLFALQDEESNRAIEWDGATESDDIGIEHNVTEEFSHVKVFNMTAIGNGKVTSNNGDGNTGLEIRSNGGGEVWNSIFTNFSKSVMDIQEGTSKALAPPILPQTIEVLRLSSKWVSSHLKETFSTMELTKLNSPSLRMIQMLSLLFLPLVQTILTMLILSLPMPSSPTMMWSTLS